MTDTPPVLLLIFNRPDLTNQVMEQIRNAKPPKLFIGADGPRVDKPVDEKLCEQTREVATQVDWDCEVYTLFREENLGLKEAVSSAITWFFEHVEAGIILEDDCVPHPSFFPFCTDLLHRYREDERIMTIGGNNFQPQERQYRESYYFSAYMHCWGWATWRRAWALYDGRIRSWSRLRETQWLEGWLGTEREAKYWRGIFDQVYNDKVDSWAYPWTFACWREHGLNILPSVNLVSNIGFGERSTHTKDEDSYAANMETKDIELPLKHPENIVRYYKADRYTSKKHYGINAKKNVLRRVVGRVVPGRLKNQIERIAQMFVD